MRQDDGDHPPSVFRKLVREVDRSLNKYSKNASVPMTYAFRKLFVYLLWKGVKCADLKGRYKSTCEVPVCVPRITTFEKN